ncbi:ester cyclase [Microbispora hainanensis]|uniref:Ester cyclase n=1 Tax=Microbispora hainanensis TaxID=568844 RepID=A0ABZ1SIK1_9ACTN|nr:ester cyclase [Microbispora hainanensis]
MMASSREHTVSFLDDLFRQVWTHGNLGLIPRFIHPDYHLLDERAEMRLCGQAGFADAVSAMRSLLGDISMRATHVVLSGDMVAYRWEMIGRLHDATRLAPALRIVSDHVPDVMLISLRGVNLGRFAQGLLVEETCESDSASLTQQMGWWG